MGLSQFLNGLGYLFGKIPIQGRRERWKNEIAALKKEKDTLLLEECDDKKSRRLLFINNRIDVLNRMLENASDAN